MKNKEQYKRLISYGTTFLLVLLLTLLFSNIWYHFYVPNLVLPFYRRGNYAMIVIYGVLILIIFQVFGGLKVGYLKRMDMVYTQMLSMVLVNTITYFQISVVGRKFLPYKPLILMTILDWLIILIWVFVANRFYFWMYKPRKLIVVYGSKTAADLVLKMSQRVDKYMICESISIEEGMDKVKTEIHRFEGMIICDVPPQKTNELVKYCFANSIRVYITPRISDIIMRGADEIRLFDSPLLLCRNTGPGIEQRIIKRIFDIIVALIILILFSPVMLLCVIAVKCYDGGDVIYRQVRLTEGGKEFHLLKFRSMIQNAEANGKAVIAKEDDDRITPVGKILRKFRLDELPQLVNVLLGDMSIVGPRPERPEIAKEFEKDMPEFSFRLKVKAGLTGYAQVTGLYDTVPYDKLKMDLMYIEHCSVLMDLKILLMTVKIVIFNPGTNESMQNNMINKEKKKGK